MCSFPLPPPGRKLRRSAALALAIVCLLPASVWSAPIGVSFHDAVRLAVDDQIRAGLDLITDGEMQRVDFNLGFYDFLQGLDPIPPRRRWGVGCYCGQCGKK